MADAERDRLDLTSRIEKLEMEKLRLEASNAAKIAENRNLLDQLEILNNNVIDSDTKIRSLEANLLSSMQTVRRLESSASRAVDAERHLALLEDEQDKLHKELRVTREDARSHAQRYKEAQRGLIDMQDQLERIEQEGVLERERHEEVVRRMEKQREVDKQLDVAAGRLKGAAASKSLQEQGKGNNKIIGHFVRDLLQDNATLQLGIAELREMLMSSNDEIQSLRDQLHLQTQEPSLLEAVASPASTLKAELEGFAEDEEEVPTAPPSLTPSLSQELHIHHHYHAVPAKEGKRVRRKRTGLLANAPYAGSTTSGSSSHRNSLQLHTLAHSESAPSLASEDLDAITHANNHNHTKARAVQQWNENTIPESDFSSSIPASPNLRPMSLFDHNLHDLPDSGSPATSYDPTSPTWQATTHRKGGSIASTRSFQSLSAIGSEAADYQPSHSGRVTRTHSGNAIAEEDEEEASAAATHQSSSKGAGASQAMEDQSFDDFMAASRAGRPRLQRIPSHESIMSLSGGLDIHTLRIRPSQMTLRPLGGADAVITGVVAQPTLSRSTNKRSDAALRDNFNIMQSPRTVSSPITRAGMTPSPEAAKSARSSLRSWTGWRPWGGTTRDVEEETPEPDTPTRPVVVESVESPDPHTPKLDTSAMFSSPASDKSKDSSRAPGINQAGAVPGFQQYWAAHKRKGAPAQVTTHSVDADALAESLLG